MTVEVVRSSLAEGATEPPGVSRSELGGLDVDNVGFIDADSDGKSAVVFGVDELDSGVVAVGGREVMSGRVYDVDGSGGKSDSEPGCRLDTVAEGGSELVILGSGDCGSSLEKLSTGNDVVTLVAISETNTVGLWVGSKSGVDVSAGRLLVAVITVSLTSDNDVEGTTVAVPLST